jgi:hypothetical protein
MALKGVLSMNMRIGILALGCVGVLLLGPLMAQNGNQGRDGNQILPAAADTTPPDIMIATPEDGANVYGRLVDVTFYAWDV